MRMLALRFLRAFLERAAPSNINLLNLPKQITIHMAVWGIFKVSRPLSLQLKNGLWLRAGKNNKLDFLWLKMARFRTPFLTPKTPPKVYVGPFLCVLSQEMRHIIYFLGVQNGVFWVGPKEFTLKKFMCETCFGPLFAGSAAKSPKMPGKT